MRAGAAFIVCLVVGACGGVDDIDDVRSPPAPLQVVLEFEGVVDGDTITIHAQGTPSSTQQALLAIEEDRNGERGTASRVDVVELTTESSNGFAGPRTVVNGCGVGVNSFDVHIGVRSFFSRRLQNVHLEMTEISSGTSNALCNSDRLSENLAVGSPGTPPSSTLGLLRYGTLGPDANGPAVLPSSLVPLPRGLDATSRARLVRFRTDGTPFSFRGRIVADVCDDVRCAAGLAFVTDADNASAPPFVETDGQVLAVAEGPGTAIIGGTFSRVGRRTGSAFRSTLSTTGAAKPWPTFEGGVVNAVVADSAGNVYVGGTFTHVGGAIRPRLARITAAGVLDTSFVPSSTLTTGDAITALALDSATTPTQLWVGRTTAPFLGVVNPTTGALTTPASLQQPNDQVLALLCIGTEIFVGGRFIDYGGNAFRNKLARLNRTTGALSGPDTTGMPRNTTSTVRALATDGTDLYIGGDFTMLLLPGTRQNVAGLRLSNGVITPWGPFFDGPVNAIVVNSGVAAYVGGAFANVTASLVTSPRANLAAVNTTNGDIVAAFVANTNNTVRALSFTGGNLVVGGDFTAIVGTPRSRLAMLSTSTLAPTTFDPAPGGGATTPSVNAFAISGGDVFAGGAFALGGGAARSRLAAVSIATGALAPASTVIVGASVNALSRRGSQLAIGGLFDSVGGTARANLAVVDASSFALASMTANTGSSVDALAFDDGGRLYVGGAFTTIAGITRNRLARLSSSGTFDAAFTAVSATTVRALAVTNDGLLIGNDVGITRVSTTGTTMSTLLTVGGPVHAFALSADRRRAYVGGAFTSLGGVTRARLAKINLDTNTIDPTFIRATPDGAVRALDIAGPALLVGGAFANVSGSSRSRLAAVDVDSGNLLAAEPLFAAATEVRAVAQLGTFAVAGGSFDTTASGAIVDVVGVDGGARRSSVTAFFGEGEAETPGSEPMPSTGCGSTLPAGYTPGVRRYPVTVTVDGRVREAAVTLPTGYSSSRAYPVVFTFHGDNTCVTAVGGVCVVAVSGVGDLNVFGLDGRISSEAIVVGLDGENLNRFNPNFTWDTTSRVDSTPGNADIRAVLALQQRLRSELCVDESRTYAVGFSGGGFLANAIACYGTPSLKGVAVFEGGFEAGFGAGTLDTSSCGPATNTLIVHASDDGVVPQSYGTTATNVWRTKAGCTSSTVASTLNAACVEHTGCVGVDVVRCTPGTVGHAVWSPVGSDVLAAFLRRTF